MARVSIPTPKMGKIPKPSAVKTAMPLQSKKPRQSGMGKLPKKPAF